MKQQRTKIAAGAAATLVVLALAAPAPATTPADDGRDSVTTADAGTLLALSAGLADAAISASSVSASTSTARSLPSAPGDIPANALLAYQRAADILAAVAPRCALSWTVLAALGKVTSDHGRATPAMRSVPDTDTLLGPMQLPESIWTMAGVDGDGDGERSVRDLDDAALATAVYLCAGSAPVATPREIEAALHRLPLSAADIALVLAYEALFRAGDFQVPDESQWASASVLSLQPVAGGGFAATPAEVTPLVGLRASTRRAARLRAELDATVDSGVQKQVRQVLTSTRQHADLGEPEVVPGSPTGTTPEVITAQPHPTLDPSSPSASGLPVSSTPTVDVPTASAGSSAPGTSDLSAPTTLAASPDPTPSTTAEPDLAPPAGSSASPAGEPTGPAGSDHQPPPAPTPEPSSPSPVEETPNTATGPETTAPETTAPETTAPVEQPSPQVVTGGTDAPASSAAPSPSCAPADDTTDPTAGDAPAPADETPLDPASMLPDPTATDPQPGATETASETAICGPATP